MRKPLAPQEFATLASVSRETLGRLEAYVELLQRWQRAINLVGESTLTDIWRRHFLDSAQLLPLLPSPPCRVADLGTGGGFPGLVLSILGAGEVHLIEADSRKSAFLREAVRVTSAPAVLHEQRIEQVLGLEVDVVVSRGLASLECLVTYALPLLKPGGMCLFSRGRGSEEELTQAVKRWKMQIDRFSSVTDPQAWIIRLSGISTIRTDERAR